MELVYWLICYNESKAIKETQMPLMVLEKSKTDLGVINTNFLSAVDTYTEVNSTT